MTTLLVLHRGEEKRIERALFEIIESDDDADDPPDGGDTPAGAADHIVQEQNEQLDDTPEAPAENKDNNMPEDSQRDQDPPAENDVNHVIDESDGEASGEHTNNRGAGLNENKMDERHGETHRGGLRIRKRVNFDKHLGVTDCMFHVIPLQHENTGVPATNHENKDTGTAGTTNTTTTPTSDGVLQPGPDDPEHTALAQCSAKKGLKTFGEEGENAILSDRRHCKAVRQVVTTPPSSTGMTGRRLAQLTS